MTPLDQSYPFQRNHEQASSSAAQQQRQQQQQQRQYQQQQQQQYPHPLFQHVGGTNTIYTVYTNQNNLGVMLLRDKRYSEAAVCFCEAVKYVNERSEYQQQQQQQQQQHHIASTSTTTTTTTITLR